MKVKTANLIGPALDWAVAKCEGLTLYKDALLNGELKEGWWVSGVWSANPNFWVELWTMNYSTSWSKSGPILDREQIRWDGRSYAVHGNWKPSPCGGDYHPIGMNGPNFLVAGLRCFVAVRLGEEVEIPEKLL